MKALNLKKGLLPLEGLTEEAIAQVMISTQDVLTTMRVEELKAIPGNVGHRAQSSLCKSSLNSWSMEPLVGTPDTKEGSFNEHQVISALRNYFKGHDMKDMVLVV